MKPRTTLTFLALCLAWLAAAGPGLAQVEENLQGLGDENVAGYISPLQPALSGTLNSAVFRTGHVPVSEFGFTIGLAVMAVGFDDADRTYVPNDPPGFTIAEEDAATEVPTVIGNPGGATVQGANDQPYMFPGGFDLEGFEIAAPQLSIGTFYGTRAVVRYFAADIGDAEIGDFSYFGIGAQHSITQWVPTLPVDVAVGGFIQSFNLGDDLLEFSAYHLNVTASRQYGLFQPYVGLGYDSLELSVKSEDGNDPDSSIDITLDRGNDVHFTLGVTAGLPNVSVFFEFNSAAASGFALGIDFGM